MIPRPVLPEDGRVTGEYVLAVLRIVMGFMLIWAFLDKLLGLGFPTGSDAAVINGGSPTEYYLTYLVSGPFASLYESLAGNAVLDILLMAGLLLVGAAMVAGVSSRLATLGMCVMMAVMFTMEIPPEDNPLVDYHVIYILAALAVYLLGGFGRLSLAKYYDSLPVIRDHGLLR